MVEKPRSSPSDTGPSEADVHDWPPGWAFLGIGQHSGARRSHRLVAGSRGHSPIGWCCDHARCLSTGCGSSPWTERVKEARSRLSSSARASQAQGSTVCTASCRGPPLGLVPLGGKAPRAATGFAQSKCVFGLELEWLAHSLASLGQNLVEWGHYQLEGVTLGPGTLPPAQRDSA